VKNISFSMTTRQFRAKTKGVTRRMGWTTLKPSDRLMGCEKCMGRKPGEPLVRLGPIAILSVRRERLDRMITEPAYGYEECRKEGFPEMTPRQFVDMFCASHKGCKPSTVVTRLRFEYL
jgi:hypothetical protein